MSKQILFIEDEKWGVNPYFKELAKNGFECELALSGDEALEKLRTKKFDCISMDIMFQPGDSLGESVQPIRAGVQLLEMIRKGKIKNCDQNVQVIVLTAVIDHEIEAQIKKLGVSAFLKKPIEYSKVIETFRNLK